MERWNEYGVSKLLDEYGMQNRYLSPLNISYLVLEKGNKVVINPNSVGIEVGDFFVMFPKNSNKKGYILDVVKCGKPVKHIRQIQYLDKVGKNAPLQVEYVMSPEKISNPQSKTIKYDVRKIEKVGGVAVELNKANKSLFIECNSVWYREQTKKGDKFRLYGKKHIERIIENYDWLREKFDCYIVGLFLDGKICSFSIGCKLSEEYSCDYSVRYVPGRGYADFARIERAKYFGKKYKYMNDGTADTKGIKQSKIHLSVGQRKSYGFDPHKKN